MSVAIGAGKLPRATRADPTASTTKVRGPGKSFFAAGHTYRGTAKKFTEEFMEPPMPVLHKKLVLSPSTAP